MYPTLAKNVPNRVPIKQSLTYTQLSTLDHSVKRTTVSLFQ